MNEENCKSCIYYSTEIWREGIRIEHYCRFYGLATKEIEKCDYNKSEVKE
jgi:hypothetical protein